MKKRAIDKLFAPKGYHAEYSAGGCSGCAFRLVNRQGLACGPDKKCCPGERPDKRFVRFVKNVKRIRIPKVDVKLVVPKVAYLLLIGEEYTTPEAKAITMSKKVAEAWKAERPCKSDSDYWNYYKELPVACFEKR
jgi:hypothetical protein